MKRLRIYVDTSVIGGCLDEEFAEWSCRLFELAALGTVNLLISELTAGEVARAPLAVQKQLAAVSSESVERIAISAEAERLRDEYLSAGVVGPAARNDALHVALATVAHADVIVSWNFRHLVHVEKIRGFNAVNLRQGYPVIDIRSPQEVA